MSGGDGESGGHEAGGLGKDASGVVFDSFAGGGRRRGCTFLCDEDGGEGKNVCPIGEGGGGESGKGVEPDVGRRGEGSTGNGPGTDGAEEAEQSLGEKHGGSVRVGKIFCLKECEMGLSKKRGMNQMLKVTDRFF